MGLFDLFKRRSSEPDTEELTDAEAALADSLAKIAGSVMKAQFDTAARHSLNDPDRKKEVIWPSQAFAFGVLAAALQSKGVPWTKLPYVSIRFAEVFMPDYGDHKELAKLICHFGIDPTYAKYKLAGERAFLRIMESDDSKDPPYPDDLARVMGFRPGKEPYD